MLNTSLAEPLSPVSRVMAQLWSLIYPAVRELFTLRSSTDTVAVLAADMVIEAIEQAERGVVARGSVTDSPEDMITFFGRYVFCYFIFSGIFTIFFPAGCKTSGLRLPPPSLAAWPTIPWLSKHSGD